MTTIKLSSSLPEGDTNGLAAGLDGFLDNPGRSQVAVVLLDTKTLTTDTDTGDVIPTVRVRQVEVLTDAAQIASGRALLNRAFVRRTGASALPLFDSDT